MASAAVCEGSGAISAHREQRPPQHLEASGSVAVAAAARPRPPQPLAAVALVVPISLPTAALVHKVFSQRVSKLDDVGAQVDQHRTEAVEPDTEPKLGTRLRGLLNQALVPLLVPAAPLDRGAVWLCLAGIARVSVARHATTKRGPLTEGAQAGVVS
jgi:hypothetical protein